MEIVGPQNEEGQGDLLCKRGREAHRAALQWALEVRELGTTVGGLGRGLVVGSSCAQAVGVGGTSVQKRRSCDTCDWQGQVWLETEPRI